MSGECESCGSAICVCHEIVKDDRRRMWWEAFKIAWQANGRPSKQGVPTMIDAKDEADAALAAFEERWNDGTNNPAPKLDEVQASGGDR